MNYPQGKEDKYMQYCSLNQALACNYREKVKIFLRREKDDKFYEVASFQHNEKDPIIRMKSFSQYLVLSTTYTIEVWKWTQHSVLNQKKMDCKIEDFCIYKRSR